MSGNSDTGGDSSKNHRGSVGGRGGGSGSDSSGSDGSDGSDSTATAAQQQCIDSAATAQQHRWSHLVKMSMDPTFPSYNVMSISQCWMA
eukprot:6461674-Ditylum_brightwellii.AAC.1